MCTTCVRGSKRRSAACAEPTFRRSNGQGLLHAPPRPRRLSPFPPSSWLSQVGLDKQLQSGQTPCEPAALRFTPCIRKPSPPPRQGVLTLTRSPRGPSRRLSLLSTLLACVPHEPVSRGTRHAPCSFALEQRLSPLSWLRWRHSPTWVPERSPCQWHSCAGTCTSRPRPPLARGPVGLECSFSRRGPAL